jgi:hypothetical protein
MTPFTDTRACGSDVTGVPAPFGDEVTFDTTLSHRRVGADVPCLWATWSHEYRGDVYVDYPAEGRDSTSITMTMPVGTRAFYFYAEPERFAVFNFIVTTSDGVTVFASTADVPIQGQAGARGFGIFAAGTTIVSVVVSTESGANGFAVGEFGIAMVSPP